MTREYSEDEIKMWEERLPNLTHFEMARLYRYAPTGHPLFNTKLGLYPRFEKQFKDFGGMTSSISKEIDVQQQENN